MSARPGWYTDPANPNLLRLWDGERWTTQVGSARAITTPRTAVLDDTPASRIDRTAAGRSIANLVIAVGLIVAGYLSWELAGTNLYTEFAQRDAREELVDRFDADMIVAAADPSSDAVAVVHTATTEAPAPAPVAPERPAHGEVVGRIQIPAIGVDAVFSAGTDTDTLKRGPGLWEHGVFPGTPGNATISGHRTTYGGPFRNIDQLAYGDQIIVSVPGHPDAVFEVRGNTKVDPSHVAVTEQTSGVRLTLTTCDPVGRASQRLVVQAELVSGAFIDDAAPAEGWIFQQ